MLIPHLLARSSRLHRSAEAVFDGERRRSFGELAESVERLALELAGRGVARGQRVAIVAMNRAEYLEIYFALARLGAVAVPVNWRLRAAEIEYVLRDSEAVAVLVENRLAEAVEACRAKSPLVRDWIVIDGARDGWRSRGDARTPSATLPTLDDLRDDDVAIQMYTSGTTGAPKGAMLTHKNVTSMVLAWLVEIRLGCAPDKLLQVSPLFHVGGMLQLMSTVAAGASLRLLPEFLPAPALDALERESVTHALFVPAMIQWLLGEKDVERRRFPALRLIIYGAAPMPHSVLTRALRVFRCDFLQGYGLTETTGVVTTLRPEEHRLDGDDDARAARRLASAGRAVLGCEVRVIDDDGRDVAPQAIGEIVVRGDQVGPGYWKRPEETRASLVNGWFRTGDLATIDSDGYVTIVDRSKDMILVAGENVYPSEIEACLRKHPAVRDAAVIGIPHEHWGEEVLALVVLADGIRPSDRELIQHCRAELARFKCPTRVEYRESIPRNAAGKVMKRELREPDWRGRAKRV
jgi:acyl-CoA synthetase (AMP-forming)/AMP-acid ligase II